MIAYTVVQVTLHRVKEYNESTKELQVVLGCCGEGQVVCCGQREDWEYAKGLETVHRKRGGKFKKEWCSKCSLLLDLK